MHGVQSGIHRSLSHDLKLELPGGTGGKTELLGGGEERRNERVQWQLLLANHSPPIDQTGKVQRALQFSVALVLQFDSHGRRLVRLLDIGNLVNEQAQTMPGRLVPIPGEELHAAQCGPDKKQGKQTGPHGRCSSIAEGVWVDRHDRQ
jgi:hypothetical protein